MCRKSWRTPRKAMPPFVRSISPSTSASLSATGKKLGCASTGGLCKSTVLQGERGRICSLSSPGAGWLCAKEQVDRRAALSWTARSPSVGQAAFQQPHSPTHIFTLLNMSHMSHHHTSEHPKKKFH